MLVTVMGLIMYSYIKTRKQALLESNLNEEEESPLNEEEIHMVEKTSNQVEIPQGLHKEAPNGYNAVEESETKLLKH